MKITAIKPQVRQQGRYSIYVEGKYSFSLSDTALLQSKLVPGQEVSQAEIGEFQQLSSDDKVYNQVLGYLAIRQRSTWEVQSYLQRKKVDPLLCQEIINKLSNAKLIDDLTFAQAWVSNRRLLRPTSRRRLQQELRAKRVPDAIAEQALAEDDTSDSSSLVELIVRKRRQTRYQDDQKLMQYLARQGYGYGDIKDALGADAE